MTQLDVLGTEAAFDNLKQFDERGNEVWSARDLQLLMGYDRWENFVESINRARLACVNSGYEAESHFRDATKITENARRQQRPVNDVVLTRYAAYLVALNGDPRKPEVAGAQTYFVVKTREAEMAPRSSSLALPDMSTAAGRLQVAEMLVNGARREVELEAAIADRDQQLAIAAPKAEYVDGFVNSDDASLIRVFAAQLNVGEKALRAWLIDRKVLYRRTVGQRWSNSKQQLVAEFEWLAYADYRPWFKPVDQPNAPRLHNGQTATTLYVTPVGKVAIRRLLMKHPIESQAA